MFLYDLKSLTTKPFVKAIYLLLLPIPRSLFALNTLGGAVLKKRLPVGHPEAQQKMDDANVGAEHCPWGSEFPVTVYRCAHADFDARGMPVVAKSFMEQMSKGGDEKFYAGERGSTGTHHYQYQIINSKLGLGSLELNLNFH